MSVARHRLTSKLKKLSVCYGIEYSALKNRIAAAAVVVSHSLNLISVEHTALFL